MRPYVLTNIIRSLCLREIQTLMTLLSDHKIRTLSYITTVKEPKGSHLKILISSNSLKHLFNLSVNIKFDESSSSRTRSARVQYASENTWMK